MGPFNALILYQNPQPAGNLEPVWRITSDQGYVRGQICEVIELFKPFRSFLFIVYIDWNFEASGF